MSNFDIMDGANKVEVKAGKVVGSTGYALKCVKSVGDCKIYVDHFMSLKHYYVLNTKTNEIRYGGSNRLRYIVEELQEDMQSDIQQNGKTEI